MTNAIECGDRFFCECGTIFSLYTLIKYIQLTPLEVYESYSSLSSPSLWTQKMLWNTLKVVENNRFTKDRPRKTRCKIVTQGGRVVL